MRLWLKIASKFICTSPLLASSLYYTNTGNSHSLKHEYAVRSKSSPAPFHPEKGKRVIYLTWDDAPQAQGTINCMRSFTANQVKATFFAVGLNVHDSLGRQLIDSIRGSYPKFLLANHSWSHAFRNQYSKFFAMPDSAIHDFLYNDSCFHFKDKIIRLPSSNSWVMAGENKGPASAIAVREGLAQIGYCVIGWDVEWKLMKGKNSGQGAEEMVREVNRKLDDSTTNAPDAIVILSHDRYFKEPAEVDSLNKFISLLKADPRNVFETIDHYPVDHSPAGHLPQ